MQSLHSEHHESEIQHLSETRVDRIDLNNADDALDLIDEYYKAVGVVARDDRATLLRNLADRRNAIWVAYCGQTPAGCILYREMPQLSSAGEIKRLYVRPEFRGCGIARRLLDALERFARSLHVEWLYLDSKDDLTDAIRFYYRHGYLRCERYNENWQATIFMRKRFAPVIEVRPFQDGDEEAFRTLNQAWIEKFFRLEEKDREVLSDPQAYVLAPGGQIFVATQDGEAVGCCALLAMGEGSWEIAKMAVAERRRGEGIGRRLLEFAIDYAKTRVSRRLYIETNSALVNAIHLYESVGFRHIPAERVHPSPYARANVYMEMLLGG